jgi:uncharacterized protein YggU (UPF0235/DUF167 family)
MFIRVRVESKSKKEEIEALDDGTLLFRVREMPERNEANRRVVQLLNTHYDVKKGTVRIILGHKSPNKIVEIPNI